MSGLRLVPECFSNDRCMARHPLNIIGDLKQEVEMATKGAFTINYSLVTPGDQLAGNMYVHISLVDVEYENTMPLLEYNFKLDAPWPVAINGETPKTYQLLESAVRQLLSTDLIATYNNLMLARLPIKVQYP